MEGKQSLLEQLKEYSKSDYYPFHMPGHKRQWEADFAKAFPNPFSVDITEIDGFDNLHHAQGILKESMEWAASVYGADRTYYLVNGSSCGILSAICGTTNNLGTILLGRNSHKSAYHGVFLNHLHAEYVYPQILDKYGVQGGLLSEDVEKMLKTHGNIQAIFVVSPTYDGIVSDVKTIATIAHKYKIPLIVDEAHGAHFRYGRDLPISALELGADIVIQSLHKTLPAFTQTALLHMKKGYVDMEKLDRYLHIYQSSSPSYLFLAGMEHCIRYMEGEEPGFKSSMTGRQRMEFHTKRIIKLRKDLKQLKHLKVMEREVIGKDGVYDLDITKIIISTCDTMLSGIRLNEILRDRYHLEMEMCTEYSVTAITTIMDTSEGLQRLKEALFEIDRELETECGYDKAGKDNIKSAGELRQEMIRRSSVLHPDCSISIDEALNSGQKRVPLMESVGMISGEYIYLYPPGIPIIVPGEVLKKEIIDTIISYRNQGLSVQGLEDMEFEKIRVVSN